MGSRAFHPDLHHRVMVYGGYQRLQRQRGEGAGAWRILPEDQNLTLYKFRKCAIIVRMNSLNRKISLLTLSIMISVMSLIYVCPMNMPMGEQSSMVSNHEACVAEQSNFGGFSIGKFIAYEDCAGMRISLISQTLSNLTGLIYSPLIVLALLFLVLTAQKFFAGIIHSFIVRMRYYCRRYLNIIKLLVNKKIRHHLNCLGNYFVVLV